MLIPKRIVVLLAAAFIVASCGGSSKYSQSSSSGMSGQRSLASESPPRDGRADMNFADDDYGEEPVSPAEPAPPPAMGMAPTALGSTPTPKSKTVKPIPTKPTGPRPVPEDKRPMLIYRATINLAVFEARKSIDEVESLAKNLGGYLVQRTDSSIVVRVPAKTFDAALETVSKVGDELHRQVQVQDVTAEFRDMQIRLKNLQAVRIRLVALLDRAKTVQEALRVERELERVAGNIESMKGKLKYFSELIAFSTITVNFQARPAESLSSEVNLPFPWLNRLGLGRLLELN